MMSRDVTEPADLLRLFVQGRDVPCPACGYNLRNTGSARCPECGAAMQLRVGSPAAPLGPWALALLSAALPLGFWLSIFGIGAHALYKWWRATVADQYYWRLGRSDWTLLGLAAAAVVTFALAVGLLLRRRHRWASRSRRARWVLAMASTVTLIGLHVAGLIFLLRVLGEWGF